MTMTPAHILARRLVTFLPVIAVILGAGMLACELIDASSVPVMATPGTEAPAPRVVIDAGHGGEDGGAVGICTGTPEAGINLAYATALRDELISRGYEVVLTREDESALAPQKKADLAKRREIINGSSADIAVSIHMNKFSDRSVSGPMAFYMNGSAEGEALAVCVIDAVCDAVGRPRRIANPGDYFIIRECSCPAVIVECGFLSNASDEALIMTDDYKEKVVRGIADGIDAYFAARQ